MQATWRHEFYAVSDPPHQIDRLNPPIDAPASLRSLSLSPTIHACGTA